MRTKCEELERRVAALEAEVAELRRLLGRTASAERRSGGLDYVAIGNSLTLHETCSYWWNPVGMAASCAERDYFHLVQAGLRRRFGEVTAKAVNFFEWERSGHDRDQTLAKLDDLLDEHVSLVTVQLGENVVDFSTYDRDYVSLLEYVRKKTGPRTQIIVIGNFWKPDPVRSAAAEKCGADYVSLAEAYDEPKYRSRIGAEVFDAAGGTHIIDHAGVAAHPGDEGMAFIAAKVLDRVKDRGVR